MAWTYSGDPGASDVDRYRFFLSDTDAEEPILQDDEVQFVIDEYTSHEERMYHLFDRAATIFNRQIENKIGPIEEKPQARAEYFASRAKYYYDKAYGNSYAVPSMKATKAVFSIGMTDNGKR